MKHTYIIDGMSCDGCRKKVEKALNEIEGVQATVSLENKEAVITMENHIPTTTFATALAALGKYTIKMEGDETAAIPEVEKKSCCASATSQNHSHNHSVTHSHTPEPGKYYCPMHCEGHKVYDEAGD